MFYIILCISYILCIIHSVYVISCTHRSHGGRFQQPKMSQIHGPFPQLIDEFPWISQPCLKILGFEARKEAPTKKGAQEVTKGCVFLMPTLCLVVSKFFDFELIMAPIALLLRFGEMDWENVGTNMFRRCVMWNFHTDNGSCL